MRYSSFKSSAIWSVRSIFDLIQIKIYKPTFMFLESIITCQNSNQLFIFSQDLPDLRIQQSDWLRVFLILSKLKFKIFLLCFMNVYLPALNQVNSSISSWDMTDLRNPQSNQLISFWFLTQELEFFKVWDLCRHKVNMNFPLTPNLEKSNDIFEKKLKKSLFLVILGSFCPFFQIKRIFLKIGKNQKILATVENSKPTDRRT